jgi:hypothetical protein
MAPCRSEQCCQLYDQPATSSATTEDEADGEIGKQRSRMTASQWELVVLKTTALSKGQMWQEQKEKSKLGEEKIIY